MAERIHPSPDPEAPRAPPSPLPSAPLIPPSTAKSDIPYPPPLPPPYSHRRRRRSCRVFRFLCCTLTALLLLLILFLGVFTAVLFLGFHPKIPHYSVDGIGVTAFQTNTDDSLSATFVVNVTARNPNKRIGVFYESGSSLSVFHDGVELCEGSLPVFYQGHRNTTVMQVPLSGRASNATALAAEVLEEEQSSGGVALVIKGKVPVRIKMGKLKLMKIRFKANCDLLVDNLTANDRITIKSSSCKIKLNRIFGITFHK